MHLDLARDYDHAVRTFDWELPARFNIAAAISDRHARATPDASALIYVAADDQARVWTHGEINTAANRLANALQGLGIAPGDRVGVHLPQSPECLIAHIAILKLGAIVVPLFRLFGPDALCFRLGDCAAVALITEADGFDAISADLAALPALATTITVGGVRSGARADTHDFETLAQRGAATFATRNTAADDPALIIYTSGTTGPPKGALHAHRVLIGHLPGVALPQDRFPQPGDRFWTPADWAWIGGLLDVLWPSLYWGVPVVGAARGRFDPAWAFDLMARHDVRNVFMPATALRLMRHDVTSASAHRARLRSLGSGGETLGGDLIAWGEDVLGVTMNESYGQTECNLVVGTC
ncbi:MAG: AMP-binding protein, partial [Pseudomonadota bacterium]